ALLPIKDFREPFDNHQYLMDHTDEAPAVEKSTRKGRVINSFSTTYKK
ncbi:MAG: hypothetical protein HUJ58_02870, partial [Erysipelotrichaceae bacterium]|nr:hypothetical protein [Erysipelotrichaceae bacterium]